MFKRLPNTSFYRYRRKLFVQLSSQNRNRLKSIGAFEIMVISDTRIAMSDDSSPKLIVKDRIKPSPTGIQVNPVRT